MIAKTPLPPLANAMQKFSGLNKELSRRIKALQTQEKRVSQLEAKAFHSPLAAVQLQKLRSKGYFELRDQSVSLCKQLEHELAAVEKQFKQLTSSTTAKGSALAKRKQIVKSEPKLAAKPNPKATHKTAPKPTTKPKRPAVSSSADQPATTKLFHAKHRAKA